MGPTYVDATVTGPTGKAEEFAGREAEIFAERDRKRSEARERRAQRRQLAAMVNGCPQRTSGTE